VVVGTKPRSKTVMDIGTKGERKPSKDPLALGGPGPEQGVDYLHYRVL